MNKIKAKRPIDWANTHIVVDGNSLARWNTPSTTWLSQCLALDPARFTGSTANYGVNGQTLSNMSSDYIAQVRADKRVGKTNILFVQECTNQFDVANDTQTGVKAKLASYCNLARADGFKVIVVTAYDFLKVLPATQLPTTRQNLLDINIWIRQNWQNFADGLIDAQQDKTFANAENLSIFPDGVHPTPAGNALMAKMAYAALLRL